MKLKVLVVDDEAVQATAFADIIRRLRPEYEVISATDGRQALNQLKSFTADVVITDICMPGMSGLELIEHIRQTGQHPEIVILSGYGEFQYAQKAIKFGVIEYLLKPVSRNDILELMNRLENRLLEKRTEQIQKEGLIRKLESTLPVYIEHQLNAWVNGCLSETEQESTIEIFSEQDNFLVIVTRIQRYGRTECIYAPDEMKKLLHRFKLSMNEALEGIGQSMSFFSDTGKGMMITLLSYERQKRLNPGQIDTVIQRFLNYSKDEMGLPAVCGISDPAGNIRKNVTEGFKQAQQALEYLFYINDRRFLHYREARLKGRGSDVFHIFENEFSDLLQKPFESITSITVGDFFERYCGRLTGVKPKKLKEYLIYAFIRAAKSRKSLIPDELYDQLVENIQCGIHGCESYRDLKPAVMKLVHQLREYSRKAESKNNHIIVQKMINYIRENYMENLSLEMAASRFHFSPSYFSVLFKACSGMGFSEYLTAVRIQKAQELLRHTSLKVYEISEKVGYKDAAYFNRIFRKEVGISPYKYRQISGDFEK